MRIPRLSEHTLPTQTRNTISLRNKPIITSTIHMKLTSLLLTLSFSFAAFAQEAVDVTIRQGLKPGATEREKRQWMETQMFENSVKGAMSQQTSAQPGQFTPEQTKAALQYFGVRALALELLLTENPQLRARADQLILKANNDITEKLMQTH